MEKNYDIILVLAGGIDANGIIHEWVKRRLDDAIIYFNKKNIPIICLGGGTYHKNPVINNNGFVIHESTACINYLKNKNIPTKYLYKEWSSYDTIGNVYFSLVNHIQFMNNIENILVITSQFHMKRTKLLFNWIYSMYHNQKYTLFFHKSSDKNLDFTNRILREKNSIHNIQQNLIPNINSLYTFHKWFYQEHNAYSCKDNNIEIINEKILNTY